MDCFLCEDVLSKEYQTLETHLRETHNVKKNHEFVLLFFAMEKSELEDLSQEYKTNLEELKKGGTTQEDNDDEELALIQSQIEFENSDDEDEEEENADVKDNSDVQGRTIIHTEGEKLLAEEEEAEIECIEILDSDDEDEGEQDADTTTTTEVLETKPDVPASMNKVNLVEKLESLNICKLCYHKCSDADKLQRHQEIVHKNDQAELRRTHFTLLDLKFPCDRCDLKFLTKNILIIHNKLMHGVIVKESRKDRVCGVCQRKVKYSSYAAHVKTHEEKKESCKLCYRKFRQNKSLEAHLKTAHKDDAMFLTKDIKDEDLTFSCRSCDLRFVSDNSARYHTRHEHQAKQKTRTGNPTYKCYFCEDKFHHPSERKSHCWDIHGKKDEILNATLVKCMVCDKVCKKTNIRNHRQIHSKSKSTVKVFQKYKCEFCPGEVFKKKQYKLHMRRLHKQKVKTSQLSFKCKLCYNQLHSNAALKMHLKTVHVKEKRFIDQDITEEDLKFPCTECDDRFVSEEILKTHTRKHQNEEYEFLRVRCFEASENSFKCTLCYTRFTHFAELLTHATSYHKEELNLFREEPSEQDLVHACPECDLKFVSNNAILYHRVKVHFSEDGTYCKLCDKTMKSLIGAFMHKLRIHGNELEAFSKTFTEEERNKSCSRCDKKFYTEGSLENHRRVEHSIIKSKKTKKAKKQEVGVKRCRLCYKDFKKNIYRVQHIKNIHVSKEEQEYIANGYVGDLKHGCDSCELKFLTESLLLKHSQKEHSSKTSGAPQSSKQSSFCNLCYFDLKRVSSLLEHRSRVHTTAEEEATFNCEEVKYSSLKFDCSFCKKKLISKSALTYHRQHVHRSKMRKDANHEISCEFCGKAFKWKNRGNLKTHMKTVHSVSDYDVTEGTMEMERNKDNNKVNDFMSFLNML